jgi:type VI secretion system protein ImpK
MKRRVATLLEDMDRRGAELGLQKVDLEDARYAIVAFIDEQLFKAPWAGRQEWMLEPLQLVYFNENTAGEGFFTRLDALERDPTRVHVLEVYYLCLTLGFVGRYAVRGGEGLGAVIDRLAAILGRATPQGDVLSPRGAPLDQGKTRARREAPVLLLAGGLVGLALLVAIVLKVALLSSTSDVTSRMQAATTAQASGPRAR